MNSEDERAVEAISRLVPAILHALHALEFSSRHLSPLTLEKLIDAIANRDSDLMPALAASRALAWPERLQPVKEYLEHAAEAAGESLAGLLDAGDAPQPIVAAYRALRGYSRAAEALYPMAAHLQPVSQFFLETRARGETNLVDRLASIDPARTNVGVMHIGGPPGTRGGFSLYVPEYYDASRAWPLVVAMHGGSGNGGAFLWSWVREARTRGLIVIAPTARGGTWSLMEPEIDGPNIDSMVDNVTGRWNIDPTRQLLTGMSDGGTFTWVLGLRGDCRFTHLAPIAASFHPMLITMADSTRVHGLPIHIIHGAQDWMFPPDMARSAEQALQQVGAAVVYREIGDLSHTYPRDENARLLDWFLGPGSLPNSP